MESKLESKYEANGQGKHQKSSSSVGFHDDVDTDIALHWGSGSSSSSSLTSSSSSSSSSTPLRSIELVSVVTDGSGPSPSSAGYSALMSPGPASPSRAPP